MEAAFGTFPAWRVQEVDPFRFPSLCSVRLSEAFGAETGVSVEILVARWWGMALPPTNRQCLVCVTLFHLKQGEERRSVSA